MFRVDVDSLEDYYRFDPERSNDLRKFHQLMTKAAPALRRYFHRGTAAGEAGMRMKMIGYGRFKYIAGSGASVEWPVIGIALQRNYISVYFSVTRDGLPITNEYAGKIGALRTGQNNFSFEKFEVLNEERLSTLVADAARIFAACPDNPAHYRRDKIVSR